MSRAERRRAQKCEQKAKTATYNLTRAQLDALVREKISGELDRVKQEATNDAINQAKTAVNNAEVDIPQVMIDDKIDQMIEELAMKLETQRMSLDDYLKYMNQDMDKLKEDLWVYGGVRLEEVEGK